MALSGWPGSENERFGNPNRPNISYRLSLPGAHRGRYPLRGDADDRVYVTPLDVAITGP